MHVLVTVDGGALSEEVMKAAAHLVDASDEVHLFSVIDAEVAHDTYGGPPVHTRSPFVTATGQILPATQVRRAPVETAGQAAQRAVSERRGHIEALAHRVPGAPRWQLHVEVANDPAEAILRKAAELGVHGIAMGTRGRRGLAQVLLGSVAESIVRRASVPVLIVREGLEVPLPQVAATG